MDDNARQFDGLYDLEFIALKCGYFTVPIEGQQQKNRRNDLMLLRFALTFIHFERICSMQLPVPDMATVYVMCLWPARCLIELAAVLWIFHVTE